MFRVLWPERRTMTSEDIYSQGILTRLVSDLKPGDRVDLEGDMYADPEEYNNPGIGESEHPEFAFAYEVVLEVTPETPQCVLVHFESGFSCGFDARHRVEVDPEQ